MSRRLENPTQDCLEHENPVPMSFGMTSDVLGCPCEGLMKVFVNEAIYLSNRKPLDNFFYFHLEED